MFSYIKRLIVKITNFKKKKKKKKERKKEREKN